MTLLLTLALASVAPQEAPPAQAAPQPAPAQAAEPQEERVICRRTRTIGSKFNRRVCGTAAEWERMNSQHANDGREMQRRGKGLSPNGG